jgi:hypothetical protein
MGEESEHGEAVAQERLVRGLALGEADDLVVLAVHDRDRELPLRARISSLSYAVGSAWMITPPETGNAPANISGSS